MGARTANLLGRGMSCGMSCNVVCGVCPAGYAPQCALRSDLSLPDGATV